jgi:hypothetical protein
MFQTMEARLPKGTRQGGDKNVLSHHHTTVKGERGERRGQRVLITPSGPTHGRHTNPKPPNTHHEIRLVGVQKDQDDLTVGQSSLASFARAALSTAQKTTTRAGARIRFETMAKGSPALCATVFGAYAAAGHARRHGS